MKPLVSVRYPGRSKGAYGEDAESKSGRRSALDLNSARFSPCAVLVLATALSAIQRQGAAGHQEIL